ncbi:MAG TPA: PAS domain S-box protein [Ohtaekwangia sp.]
MALKKKGVHQLSEKGFQALIQNLHEGIVVYDQKGKIKFASKSAQKITGYPDKELIGKDGKKFLQSDDVEEAREIFHSVLQKPGQSINFFQRIRHKKGHFFWAESRLTNFTNIPEINGIVSNFRDVTESRIAEEKVRQSQQLLETINQNLSEGIYMGIVGEKFIYVNDAFLKMFNYRSFKEVQKIKPADVYANDSDRKRIVDVLLKSKKLKGEETLFRKKDGKQFWGILNTSLIHQIGKKSYFVGSIRDISREKQAASDLIDSRNFLNNIINTVGAPIFVKDEKHRWILFNKHFADLMGKTHEQLMGKTDKDFIPAKEVKGFWKIDDEVLRTGKTIHNHERITTTDGQVHELLTVKSRYRNEHNEKFVIGFITDITHIKGTEEKINQLNANLRGILESTKESVYAVDSDLNYLAFNENHSRIMKNLYSAAIEIGKNKIQYFKNSSDSHWVESEIKRALRGNHFISEHYLEYPGFTGYIQTTFNPIRNSKNEVRGVAVFVNDVTQRKQFEEIIKSINANLRAVLESTTDHILAVDQNFRYITFNRAHAESFKILFGADIKFGSSFIDILTPELQKTALREVGKALNGEQFIIEEQLVKDSVFEVSFNPIRKESGEITGVAIFAREISQRKAIEEKLKQLNDELTRQNTQLAAQEDALKTTLNQLSEKNYELDQLMYKTSHDLRSPLSSIMGLVNLAILDTDSSNSKEYLGKIEGRIKKLDEFIRSMLNYARVNRVELTQERINLREVALTCIRELEYLENFSAIETKLDCEGNDSIITDPLRIRIIFSNIISNAYKYYNSDVKSFLKIGINVGQRIIRIDFSDNGIGIKPEHMDKIFNMFYRATDRSQGSGLGMYIVKQAVDKLKGQIKIQSEFGQGTHIRITIPAVSE